MCLCTAHLYLAQDRSFSEQFLNYTYDVNCCYLTQYPFTDQCIILRLYVQRDNIHSYLYECLLTMIVIELQDKKGWIPCLKAEPTWCSLSHRVHPWDKTKLFSFLPLFSSVGQSHPPFLRLNCFHETPHLRLFRQSILTQENIGFFFIL